MGIDKPNTLKSGAPEKKIVGDTLLIIFPDPIRPGVRRCSVYGPGQWGVRKGVVTSFFTGVNGLVDDDGNLVGKHFNPVPTDQIIGKEQPVVREAVAAALKNVDGRGVASVRVTPKSSGVKSGTSSSKPRSSGAQIGFDRFLFAEPVRSEEPAPAVVSEPVDTDVKEEEKPYTGPFSRPLPKDLQALVDAVVLPPKNGEETLPEDDDL